MSKFIIAIAVCSFYATVASATTNAVSSFRGLNDNNRYRRTRRTRHLMEDNLECVLYLKIISYEDSTDLESWSCEFTRTLAKKKFNGCDIMSIIGVNKEVIDSLNAVSGETILRTTGAYVEEILDSASRDSNDGEDIRLVVTDPSNIIIEHIKEEDARHHRYHKNRRLSKINTGVLKTLVVRSIAPNGNVVDASADQLRSDVFEDEVCLKKQMEACSFNQLEIRPATVGNGGVVDVNIDINPVEDDTRNGNRGQLAESAVAKTDELYGGQDGLASEYDLVLFCQPPGSGRWDAFAYLNRYDSYYNKNRCSVSGVLMHEVGHDFGLSHSGKGGGDIYGDITGYMGAGSTEDDGPKNCYNAVKNYRLGWYDLQLGSTNPLDYSGSPKSFVLNGVADYKKDGSSNGELISLRLEQFGDDNGIDFYLGYNRKAGVNSGVSQGADQVILYSKDRGSNSALSTRIAMLDVGESYTIDDYRGNGSTVTIKFDKLSNGMKDATITLSSTPPPPTAAPTISCGGFGRFKVEIGIDNFGGENYWKLFEKGTNNLVEEGLDQKEYKPNKIMFEPTDGAAFCLDPGSCYDFKIYDTHGDGLKKSQGGFFRGFLGEEAGGGTFTKIFEGAEFSTEDKRSFCVDDISPGTPTYPPTRPPTNAPTSVPTMAPVAPTIGPTGECFDDADLRYGNVKRCKWVGRNTATRCELSWQNKLLKEFCPIKCGICQPGASTNSPTTTPTYSPTSTPTYSPTNSPTTTPTFSPTNSPTTAPTITIVDRGECEDSTTFRFNNKGAKDCATWVAGNPSRLCRRKAPGTEYGVKFFCPSLCKDKCKTDPPQDMELTNSPTNLPTTTIVDRGECEDSTTFRYNNRVAKDCATWVARNPSRLCRRKAPGTGYGIKFFCPSLCKDKCKTDFVSPSLPPPTLALPNTDGSCTADRTNLRYNDEGAKDCNWVASIRIKKKCKKMENDISLKIWCPFTCGKVGLGPCKDVV